MDAKLDFLDNLKKAKPQKNIGGRCVEFFFPLGKGKHVPECFYREWLAAGETMGLLCFPSHFFGYIHTM
jgi:hypothetical protein